MYVRPTTSKRRSETPQYLHQSTTSPTACFKASGSAVSQPVRSLPAQIMVMDVYLCSLSHQDFISSLNVQFRSWWVKPAPPAGHTFKVVWPNRWISAHAAAPLSDTSEARRCQRRFFSFFYGVFHQAEYRLRKGGADTWGIRLNRANRV